MKGKNNFFYLIAIAIVFPAFNGCRKGAEDPLLSLRSRNARIEGTWTLKSLDYSYSTDTRTSQSNTVNSDTYSGTNISNYSITYDGTKMVVVEKNTSSSTDNYKQYDFPTSSFVAKTNSSSSDKTETWTTTYSITVSIYKNNTYAYTITKSEAGYVRSTVQTVNGSSVTPFPKDTSIAGTFDGTNYYTKDDDIKTEYGTWGWEDELLKGDKDKIVLNAGPLSGYVLRLSNKELIIDYAFSGVFTAGNYFVNSATYNALTCQNNTNQVESDNVTYSTYNNSSPSQTASGTETTTTTVVKTVVAGKSTWEKTDKKKKPE